MADTFVYKVRTTDGRILNGSMEADGEALVASRLRQQGMIPVQITKEAKVSMKMELNIIPKRVKLKDLAIFARQFATMINSGLSLIRALNILGDQTENPKLAEAIVAIKDDVQK